MVHFPKYVSALHCTPSVTTRLEIVELSIKQRYFVYFLLLIYKYIVTWFVSFQSKHAYFLLMLIININIDIFLHLLRKMHHHLQVSP